ncbi:MAG: CHAD domain-containing protein [Candidatus Sulfopaludibacter sp.]|nr:CHAD domain-containing protein [Candidatus Sulfopaludibacter sp.]
MRKYVQQQTRALLGAFARRLTLAAETGDAGAIHDLRVAIRRLSRGLRTFVPYYPDRSWKSIRTQLRHVMRLAGAVRDRDIALECLAKAGIAAQAAIVTRLESERRQANEEFLAEIRQWKQRGITRQWSSRLTVPVPPNERSTARAHAARTLPRLAADYFRQVRALLAEGPHPRELHRARLATKRFRYTLELFRSCYGTGLETRIAELRRVQQVLGDVNDSMASRDLLSKAMEKSPERKKIRRFLKERAGQDAASFRKEWEERFDAPGREAWWKTYLKNMRQST